MSKKIKKADSMKFYKGVVKFLTEELKAEKVGESPSYEYKVETAIGGYYIKVDNDNTYCYSLFGNFLEQPEAARVKIGHWKCNSHMSGEHNTVEAAIEATNKFIQVTIDVVK